jgi:hypothetical protein
MENYVILLLWYAIFSRLFCILGEVIRDVWMGHLGHLTSRETLWGFVKEFLYAKKLQKILGVYIMAFENTNDNTPLFTCV